MAHQKSPGQKTGIFCCAIPLAGAASAFAQALRLSSRGPVAKNAPQERFLYAPADGAPGFSREGKRRRSARACGLCGNRQVGRPGFFVAPSPAGRLRRSRKRSASARGEVAKNAPQERFLHAPADGAPGFSREGKRRRRNARGGRGGTQGGAAKERKGRFDRAAGGVIR